MAVGVSVGVGGGSAVCVEVGVAVEVGLAVLVTVGVDDASAVGVGVGVAVEVGLAVLVTVGVGDTSPDEVAVAVGVGDGCPVGVAVAVAVGVDEGVGLGVLVEVGVAVGGKRQLTSQLSRDGDAEPSLSRRARSRSIGCWAASMMLRSVPDGRPGYMRSPRWSSTSTARLVPGGLDVEKRRSPHWEMLPGWMSSEVAWPDVYWL